MPVNTRWLDDSQQIILYEFTPNWDWQQVTEAFNQGNVLANSVTHTVDCIMDFTATGIFVPKGAFSFAKQALSNKPAANMQMTVLVGPRYIKTMGEISRKMSGKNTEWTMHFLTTRDEAIAHLMESVATP